MSLKTEEHRLFIKSKTLDGISLEVTLSKIDDRVLVTFRHGEMELKSIEIAHDEANEIIGYLYSFM